MKYSALVSLIFLFFLFGCKKETETIVFQGNTIPNYDEVPTLLVENYVNRLYIDLIGREPTDAEMSADVSAMESGDLSAAARSAIVDKLMTSTSFVEGDSTYSHAYAQKLYDDSKSRFLEGAAESDLIEQYTVYYYISVQDSIMGDILGYELTRMEANKLKAVMNSKYQIRMNQITVGEMCRRMCFNLIYDDINMNAFNFINATFDNLFFRFPTDAELDQCFSPVESNLSGVLFGQVITSKTDFLNVMIASDEYSEGMIRWAYGSLLSREPSTVEIYNLLDDFNNGQNIRAVQKSILITDEYAGF